MNNDRTVYADAPDGRQVVRYDRAGRWGLEQPGHKTLALSVNGAAWAARNAIEAGGRVHYGLPGGLRFYAELRKVQQP